MSKKPNKKIEPAEQVKTGMSVREKIFIALIVVAVAAAGVGFYLFAKNQVPSTAAAKVNDTYIDESSVASWISQYRTAYGYTSDDDFATLLTGNSQTVSDFRIYAINQLATAELVEQRCQQLGITVSDEEVQAQLDSVKSAMSMSDGDLWTDTLNSYGLTEEELLGRYRTSLLKEKLVAAEVPARDATDDEVLAYVQNYLGGTTQMHVSRIVFTGDDAQTRAQACLAELDAAKGDGTLSADAFASAAVKYSDEENVATTKGSLGWTGSGNIGDEISEVIEYMSTGDYSLESISENDDLEIIYIDSSFTFPAASNITSIASLNIPDELLDAIKNATSLAAQQNDQTAYTSKLLAEASVTYYPIPADAAYNVSLS